MSTTSSVDYSVAQIVQAGPGVQVHVENLIPSVHIDSIPAGEGWAKVEGVSDGSKILDGVRGEFKKDFIGSQEVVVKDDLSNDHSLTT